MIINDFLSARMVPLRLLPACCLAACSQQAGLTNQLGMMLGSGGADGAVRKLGPYRHNKSI